MSVPTFTKAGAKATTAVTLDKSVFSTLPRTFDLLKLAYDAHLANSRLNLATTKTRGEVRGGGKKPWRQKGTGRARVGSSRVPQWRGGGSAFGPTGNENYSLTVPVRAKRTALRQALSLAAKDNRIRVVDAFEPADGKAQKAAGLLQKLDATGRVLIVVEKQTGLLTRATSNLPDVKAVYAMNLTVFDLLNADSIVISKSSLELISAWLGEPKKTTKPAAEGAKS